MHASTICILTWFAAHHAIANLAERGVTLGVTVLDDDHNTDRNTLIHNAHRLYRKDRSCYKSANARLVMRLR